MAKKQTTKDIMLAHSAAKVDYYRKYLGRYLSIMSVAPNIEEVNIFDVFCGRGVYDDGGLGSPIRAVEVVKEVRAKCPSNTRINLFFNDAQTAYVKRVKAYIEDHFPDSSKYCNITYLNAPVERLFDKLVRFIDLTTYGTMNFLFVDPYGYKDINKNTIQRLMSKPNTEMLLFLPISFMHRFTHYAFNEDANNGALKLRAFIEQFFPTGHKIRQDEPMDVLEYIDALAEAFSFNGDFYTSSYFIKRDCRNYFALFSICHSLLGLEKAIETKWSLDEEDGQGFHLPDQFASEDLFSDYYREENKKEHFEVLKMRLIDFLSRADFRYNSSIYRFILRLGFLPKHANEVLRELQDNNLIEVSLFDQSKTIKKHSFYISYAYSKDTKCPKALIKLKR